MITVGGFLANAIRRVWPPRIADELVVDDLDDLLGRVQGAADLGAERPLAHGGGELPDHRQRDVGVEQGDPDVADRRVDVRLGEAALAAQALEGDGQAVREAGEHGSRLSSPGQHSVARVDQHGHRLRHAGRRQAPAAELGDVERVERLPRVGGDVGAADAQPGPGEASCRSRAAARPGRPPAPRPPSRPRRRAGRPWPGSGPASPTAASALAVRLGDRRRSRDCSGERSPSARRRSPRARAAASGGSPPGDSTCHSSAATPS